MVNFLLVLASGITDAHRQKKEEELQKRKALLE
jgi:hypothetical protein